MKKKLIFSRIHYWGLFWINFKNEIFNDLLSIKEKDWFVNNWSYKWYLSELEKENIEWIEYIIWEITKIIPKEDVISIDKHTKKEISTVNEDVKDNESLFILFPAKNLIWFEVSKTLTKNQFFNAFKEWYLSINSNTEPEFDLIYDEEFLMEMLNSFYSVSSAKFDLKTTNPDSREEFKKIDDLFQITNSETNKLYLSPKKWESLDFKNKDSIVKQWLAMSSSWYWSWTIIWRDKENKKLTIKTWDQNLKEIQIDETETKDEIKRKIVLTFNTLTN